MRILVVTPAIAPAIGGAESLAANLCEAALRAGDRLDLATGTHPNQHLSQVIGDRAGKVVVIDRGDPGDRMRWDHDTFYRAETIFQLIRDRRPDQIWVLSHDAAISTAIALAGIAKQPTVFAVFSEIATDRLPFVSARYAFASQLDSIDRIVCLSRRYEQVVLDAGARLSKTVINPLGIDLRRFNHQGRELAEAVDVVLCPSRFTERKGQLDLITAFAGFLRYRPSTTLVLAGAPSNGSTSYLDRVRQTVERLEISNNVSIRTDVSNADMPQLLHASDLVVQPSHYEGLGYSAIEAMAAGTPVVLTDVAGFNEFAVDDVNCSLVQPKRPDQLAATMAALSQSLESRSRIAQGGIATASRHFDIDVNYSTLSRPPETECR